MDLQHLGGNNTHRNKPRAHSPRNPEEAHAHTIGVFRRSPTSRFSTAAGVGGSAADKSRSIVSGILPREATIALRPRPR